MQELNLADIRHAVVVAPHSDDETIAAFHTIKKLRHLGSRVSVIVVTDGSASHRNSMLWPRDRLIVTRQHETLAAMAMADMPACHVKFLGLPDGGLDSITGDQYRRAVVNLRQGRTPDLVIVPDPDDDHPDHRNVAAMCDDAWPPRVFKLRYVVWPRSGDNQGQGARQVIVRGNLIAKRSALERYQTQLGLIADDPDGFSIDDAMLRRVCRPVETFTC